MHEMELACSVTGIITYVAYVLRTTERSKKKFYCIFHFIFKERSLPHGHVPTVNTGTETTPIAEHATANE
jgi:hypothetical protein